MDLENSVKVEPVEWEKSFLEHYGKSENIGHRIYEGIKAIYLRRAYFVSKLLSSFV